ncbi:MAG: hypothetical protein ABH858_01445 [Candidatus Omnitrophota bacterium]
MEKKESKIIEYFHILKKHGRLESSYLFAGDNLDLVITVAKLINCSFSDYFCDSCDDCLRIEKKIHPDIFTILPGKGKIKIETIREAQRFLCLKSFQAKKKVLIVDSAHCLSKEAASAFLKTLEEPPANCCIILVSGRTDLILSTILSRCRKVYLPYNQQVDDSLDKEIIEFLKNGRLYINDREYLSSFLLRLIRLLRDCLVSDIYKKTNKLINENDYEIIRDLNLSGASAGNKLEGILKIYTAIENINVNLACNLLGLIFAKG